MIEKTFHRIVLSFFFQMRNRRPSLLLLVCTCALSLLALSCAFTPVACAARYFPLAPLQPDTTYRHDCRLHTSGRDANSDFIDLVIAFVNYTSDPNATLAPLHDAERVAMGAERRNIHVIVQGCAQITGSVMVRNDLPDGSVVEVVDLPNVTRILIGADQQLHPHNPAYPDIGRDVRIVIARNRMVQRLECIWNADWTCVGFDPEILWFVKVSALQLLQPGISISILNNSLVAAAETTNRYGILVDQVEMNSPSLRFLVEGNLCNLTLERTEPAELLGYATGQYGTLFTFHMVRFVQGGDNRLIRAADVISCSHNTLVAPRVEDGTVCSMRISKIANVSVLRFDSNKCLVGISGYPLPRRDYDSAKSEFFVAFIVNSDSTEIGGAMTPRVVENILLVSLSGNVAIFSNVSGYTTAALFAVTKNIVTNAFFDATAHYTRNVSTILMNNNYVRSPIAFAEARAAKLWRATAFYNIGRIELNNNYVTAPFFYDVRTVDVVTWHPRTQFDSMEISNNTAFLPWNALARPPFPVQHFFGAGLVFDVRVVSVDLYDDPGRGLYGLPDIMRAYYAARGEPMPTHYFFPTCEIASIAVRDNGMHVPKDLPPGAQNYSAANSISVVYLIVKRLACDVVMMEISNNKMEHAVVQHLLPELVMRGGARPSEIPKPHCAGEDAANDDRGTCKKGWGFRDEKQIVTSKGIAMSVETRPEGQRFRTILVRDNTINLEFVQTPGTEHLVDANGEVNGYLSLAMSFVALPGTCGNLLIQNNSFSILSGGKTSLFVWATNAISIALTPEQALFDQRDYWLNKLYTPQQRAAMPVAVLDALTVENNNITVNDMKLCAPSGCSAIQINNVGVRSVYGNFTIRRNVMRLSNLDSDLNKMRIMAGVRISSANFLGLDLTKNTEITGIEARMFFPASATMQFTGNIVLDSNNISMHNVVGTTVSLLVLTNNVSIDGDLILQNNNFRATSIRIVTTAESRLLTGPQSAVVASLQTITVSSMNAFTVLLGLTAIPPGMALTGLAIGGPNRMRRLIFRDTNHIDAPHLDAILAAVYPLQVDDAIVFDSSLSPSPSSLRSTTRPRQQQQRVFTGGGALLPLMHQTAPVTFKYLPAYITKRAFWIGGFRFTGSGFNGEVFATFPQSVSAGAAASSSSFLPLDLTIINASSRARGFSVEILDGATVTVTALRRGSSSDGAAAGDSDARAPSLVSVLRPDPDNPVGGFHVRMRNGSKLTLRAENDEPAYATSAFYDLPIGSNISIVSSNISMAQHRSRASVVSISPTTKTAAAAVTQVTLFEASFDTRGGSEGDRSRLISWSPVAKVRISTECSLWNDRAISPAASYGGPDDNAPAVAYQTCRGRLTASRTQSASVSTTPMCAPFRLQVVSASLGRTAEYLHYRRMTVAVALVLDAEQDTRAPVSERWVPPTAPPLGEVQARDWTIFRRQYDSLDTDNSLKRKSESSSNNKYKQPLQSQTPAMATVVSAVVSAASSARLINVELLYPEGAPALSRDQEYVIILALDPMALACNASAMNGYDGKRLLVSVPLTRPGAVVLSWKASEAIKVAGVTGMVLSSVFARSSMVMRTTARLKLMERYENCLFDPEEPLGFELSPLNLQVGTDRGRYLRGAVIGNGLVIVIFVSVLSLVALGWVRYRSWRRRRQWEELQELVREAEATTRNREKEHRAFDRIYILDIRLDQHRRDAERQEHKSFWKRFRQALRSLAFVELLLALNSILMQGTVSAAVSLFVYGPAERNGVQVVDRMMAVLALLVTGAVGVWGLYVVCVQLPRLPNVQFVWNEHRRKVRIEESDSPDESEVVRYLLHVPSKECAVCAAARPRNRQRIIEQERQARRQSRTADTLAAFGGGGDDDGDDTSALPVRNMLPRWAPLARSLLYVKSLFAYHGDWEVTKLALSVTDELTLTDEQKQVKEQQMANARRAARRFYNREIDLILDLTGNAPWYDCVEYMLLFVTSFIQGFYPNPGSPACEGVGLTIALLNVVPLYFFIAFRPTYRHWVLDTYALISAFIITLQSVGLLLRFAGIEMFVFAAIMELTDEILSITDLVRSGFDIVTLFCESPKGLVYLVRRIKHIFFHVVLVWLDNKRQEWKRRQAASQEQQLQPPQTHTGDVSSASAGDVSMSDFSSSVLSYYSDHTMLTLSSATAHLRSRSAKPRAWEVEQLGRSRSAPAMQQQLDLHEARAREASQSAERRGNDDDNECDDGRSPSPSSFGVADVSRGRQSQRQLQQLSARQVQSRSEPGGGGSGERRGERRIRADANQGNSGLQKRDDIVEQI